MAFVITDLCTKCMNCTEVCPVTCIHPGKDEPGVSAVAHLNVDPQECISCGACASACPQEAIFAEEDLPADKAQFVKENAEYFKK